VDCSVDVIQTSTVENQMEEAGKDDPILNLMPYAQQLIGAGDTVTVRSAADKPGKLSLLKSREAVKGILGEETMTEKRGGEE